MKKIIFLLLIVVVIVFVNIVGYACTISDSLLEPGEISRGMICDYCGSSTYISTNVINDWTYDGLVQCESCSGNGVQATTEYRQYEQVLTCPKCGPIYSYGIQTEHREVHPYNGCDRYLYYYD